MIDRDFIQVASGNPFALNVKGENEERAIEIIKAP